VKTYEDDEPDEIPRLAGGHYSDEEDKCEGPFGVAFP
jgi:hypothetical protein